MDRLLELLAKRESKALTPAEQVELSDLLSDESSRVFSDIVEELFQTPSELQAVKRGEVNAAVNGIIERIGAKSVKRKRGRLTLLNMWRMAAVAAIFLFVCGLSYMVFQKKRTEVVSESIVQTKKGSKSMTTLPDGTKVWINSDTKLMYEKSFGEKDRAVTLEGEAFFDVAEDEDRPFIVHTRDIDVQVLGTVFNVRAYSSESNTQATLIKGSVEVRFNNENESKVLLKPNEKIIVAQKTGDSSDLNNTALMPELVVVPVRSKPDSLVIETQWVHNKLAFEDQSLREIVRVLERWYDVEIIMDDKLVSKRLFNGIFENDNLDDVMRTLGLTLKFNYKIEGKRIYIY